MTARLYLEDADLLAFDAEVLATRTLGGAPAVVLDRTAFYPEGGGQPADRGRLGDAQVVDVQEVDGEILHAIAGAVPSGRVQGEVDAARRRDHVQQHHGQHLLSAAFEGVAGARTVVASLWKVDDRATERLMTSFYRHLWQERLPPLQALRQAQLEILRSGVADPDDVPFNFFYTSNVSLPRGTFLALGGFDEEFPYAAWEDVELAYRATRAVPALRLVYRPTARTLHDHPTTLASFRRRQRRAGAAAATFARKHPELSHWLGLEEAKRPRTARPPRLVLMELAIRLLDPLGIRLPDSTYDRVLRWDYVEGLRDSVREGA